MKRKSTKKKIVKLGNEEHSVAEWARLTGTTRQNMHARLKRHSPADAIRDEGGRAVVQKRAFSTWVLCRDGKHRTVTDAATYYEVSPQTMRRWVRSKAVEVYREQVRVRHPAKCSYCKTPGCAVNRCPKLYLVDRAGRRVPYAPPTEAKLRAAGILPRNRGDG